MTSPIETNNVVERLLRTELDQFDDQDDRGDALKVLVNPDGLEAADLIQSLSDRIDELAKLAGDVRWQELSEGAQFTIIDRIMLRDLYAAGQASLTQGGNTNG